MAPATPTSRCNSEDCHEVSDEVSPVSLISSMVCQCENQLAHWDWAGRLHPNLPECCWPSVANGYAIMVSHIPVNNGKISVQQYINSCTHKVLQQMTIKV